MKIGLWNDSTRFPNLCSMKISTYEKSRGNSVELFDPKHTYDLIYASKVFTESIEPDFGETPVIRGGSGYDLHNKLPDHIEHICPDYTLYPDFHAALGVLTRGCPRLNHAQSHGGFCITPDKDGCRARKVANLSEFWTGQKEIYLLDQNLLAALEREELLQQLIDSRATITFDGGMDIRFMTGRILSLAKQLRVRDWHFAWDDPRENLEARFKEVANSGLVRPNKCGVYVLTNFWSSTDEDLYRIYTLRKYNFVPYVMIYDKQKFVDARGRWLPGVGEAYTNEQLEHFKVCQHLQRWCNNRRLIRNISNFDNYEPYTSWVAEGKPIPRGDAP